MFDWNSQAKQKDHEQTGRSCVLRRMRTKELFQEAKQSNLPVLPTIPCATMYGQDEFSSIELSCQQKMGLLAFLHCTLSSILLPNQTDNEVNWHRCVQNHSKKACLNRSSSSFCTHQFGFLPANHKLSASKFAPFLWPLQGMQAKVHILVLGDKIGPALLQVADKYDSVHSHT